jgi:putative cell wall-binding protein
MLGLVLALLLLGSGGMIVGTQIASQSGERSRYSLLSAHGERFDEVVTVRADDNAGTSVAFSRLAFPTGRGANTVVIGRDDVFADNLAAGILQSDGPLLLTDGRILNATVRDEILRLAPKRAYIVGGPGAITPQVEEELRSLGLGVTRLAGPTRVETAIAIANHAAADSTRAVLVRAHDAAGGDSSQAWIDSLAAGAYAAAAGVPVLMSGSQALHPAVGDWLAGSKVKRVFAIGGGAALGKEILRDVEALGMRARRIAGGERSETAVAIAQRLWGFDGSRTATQVILIDGYAATSWAAGVAAAAFAGKFDAPLVLSQGGRVPAATEAWIRQGGARLVCGSSVSEDACRDAATAPPAEGGGDTGEAPPPRRGDPPRPQVRLDDDDREGRALFSVDLVPGETETREMTVRNVGRRSLDVRLFGQVSGPFADILTLRVIGGVGANERLVYAGTLAGFGAAHADYDHGLDEWAATTGKQRVYRFTVQFPREKKEQANAEPGNVARTTFIWEGRS